MVYEEVKFGAPMYEFKVGEPIEGKVEQIKEDVGKNKSVVYIVGDKTFWGTSSLDAAMDSANNGTGIKLGQQVRITLTDSAHKFPNGRVGRLFKVEVDK